MKKEKLTHTEQYIYSYLINNPENLKMNITELAKLMHVSTSSIIRTLKKKGYSGYSEYRSLTKNKVTRRVGNFSDDINAVINKNLEEVLKTIDLLSAELVEEMVTILHRAEHLYIFALGSTTPIANYLVRKFNLLNRSCFNIDDDDLLLYFSKQSTSRDVILVISQSGETPSLVNAVRLAKSKGSKILLLSSGLGSTLEQISDLTMLSHESPLKKLEIESVDTASRMSLQMNARILSDSYVVYRNMGKIKYK
ncbi:MurR/RpiR family transcriptional regulator [Lactococcus garvieae]|jgi:DNA-binding MurR/RpiR family transcriptional regulator|uniref:Transcriptional regulator n=1 Tax=Lactococcus garvieae DCC43 TaxID=1231377 RepID=K2NUX2_9LACT|nr:MurR/RpiR family transcriptional regulator [Lactococcus garvieae]EKF51328.1 Transcriptional regulator [Lactococcus garvieae DCC43]QPS70466.1 MurR/RpiR family transcriptional regulator [Lactococcus garvieae]